MPIPTDQLTLLEQQLQQCKQPFENGLFRTAREQWSRLLHRRYPVEFEEELRKWGHGIDLETPELEHYYTEHVKILGIGQTDVVTHALEESQDAKKDIEDIGVWKQAWLYNLNEAGNISQSMSEAQVGNGVWIGRIHWKMPEQFEWGDKADDEDYGSYSSRSMRERERFYSNCAHDEFRVEDVNHDQCYWFPATTKPDIFFQDCLVPYSEYRLLKNRDGKYLNLDKAAKEVVWLGKPEAVDSNTDTNDRKVHILYRAMREPGTTHWTMTEFVYGGGGDLLKDGDILDEYDVPGNMCPYVIVPSGEEQVRETDPHLRFRPKMYRSYVHAVDWNYLRSLIAILARKEAGDHYLYIDPSYSLKPEQLPMLEEIGIIDASGAQRRMTYRQPDPGPGEIALSARYFRKPESPKEALFWLLEDTKEAFAATAPNRFLTGTAFSETEKGTGTAVVNQTQAAAFTYDGDLDEQAKGWRYILQFIDACYLAWWEDHPSPWPAYLPVTESFMKKAPDPRTNVHVTYDKLMRHFAVAVNVTNETQQEKLVRYEMADNDYARGLISFEEYLRRRDVANPKQKIRELNQERHRVMAAQEFRQWEADARKTLFSALTGLNLMASTAPAPAMPQPGGGMPMGGPGAVQQPTGAPQLPIAQPIIPGDSMGQGAALSPATAGGVQI